ncbi:M48 family metallopeptidase [Hymenobacter sp. BT175]|uniref:M48 family metallopeptidase n=1 Tax=Hymenobacter translucens TaxID=2886507 RepID=UPI001D0EE5C9|nr:SprT family zinc-dependent metalloprotease [Hymenobacter translucens]MCC2547963.1 M48 family metallopeptidase [Hymenobacter translucens]
MTTATSPAGGTLETVRYGDHDIVYRLVFRPRLSLGLQVRADGSVRITAPAGTTRSWVAAQVLRRADWILKHQAAFQRQQPERPPLLFETGEQHLFEGKLYPLMVEQAARARVALRQEQLVLAYPAPHSPEKTAQLLSAWYGQQAPAIFAAALDRVWPRFAEFNLPRPTLLARRMRTRWGSCTATTNRIRLNIDLVKAQPGCLDYVLLHECCHLLVPNHSSKFYDLQTRLMPDWEEWKKKLTEQVK